MICIIHKILVLLKNRLNYLRDSIFECFFKEYNRFLFFKRKKFIKYNDPRPEKENIIKDIRNLFRLKKELSLTATEDVRNLFRQEKESKSIKDRILRDIKNLFEHKEEENYYKPVTISNF